MAEKPKYLAAGDGWIDGVWRAKGDEIALTPRQAEHLLIAGAIVAPPPAAPPAQPVADKKPAKTEAKD